MSDKILLLRISYWWGIIADAVMALMMLSPDTFLASTSTEVTHAQDFGYGMRYGAPLMIGWTMLLYWADRKPLARRDILPLTLVVVAGYILFELYSMHAGYTQAAGTAPVLLMQAAMCAMFIYSYWSTRDSA